MKLHCIVPYARTFTTTRVYPSLYFAWRRGSLRRVQGNVLRIMSGVCDCFLTMCPHSHMNGCLVLPYRRLPCRRKDGTNMYSNGRCFQTGFLGQSTRIWRELRCVSFTGEFGWRTLVIKWRFRRSMNLTVNWLFSSFGDSFALLFSVP